MRQESIIRSATVALGLAATLVMGTVLFGQDTKPARRPPMSAEEINDLMLSHRLLRRPEFQPGRAERAVADEPTIAEMGADWSHGVELRAKVDRTEYRQLQRIHVRCEATNVSGRAGIGLPPLDPWDRYLRMRVRVFDAKGKLVPLTEYYKHEGRQTRTGVGATLSSFENHMDSRLRIDVIPNLVYDMTRPGDYWVLVEMQLASPDRPSPKNDFYARARPIKVKVLPEVDRVLPDGRKAIIDPDQP